MSITPQVDSLTGWMKTVVFPVKQIVHSANFGFHSAVDLVIKDDQNSKYQRSIVDWLVKFSIQGDTLLSRSIGFLSDRCTYRRMSQLAYVDLK